MLKVELPLLIKLKQLINGILDEFSTRLCFACHAAFADPLNKNFCSSCFKEILSKQRLERKDLKFSFAELDYFLKDSDYIEPKIFYLFEYDASMKSFIREFKYRSPFLIKDIIELVVEIFIGNLSWVLTDMQKEIYEKYPSQFKGDKKIRLYFSYMPLNEKRLKTRKYNQVKTFAEYLLQELKKVFDKKLPEVIYQSSLGLKKFEIEEIILLDYLFTRSKNTDSLFDKKKTERMEILESAFELKQVPSLDKDYENLLIVLDDITTTGTSFLELNRKASRLDFDDIFYIALSGKK